MLEKYSRLAYQSQKIIAGYVSAGTEGWWIKLY